MGSRGPIQGDRVDDARGRVKTAGVALELAVPELPPCLCKEENETAVAEWARLVERLREVGTLSRVDGNAMGRYCNDFVLYKQAIHRSEVFQDEEEKVRAVNLALTIARSMERFEKTWGLNPEARARLPIPAQATDDDEEGLDL